MLWWLRAQWSMTVSLRWWNLLNPNWQPDTTSFEKQQYRWVKCTDLTPRCFYRLWCVCWYIGLHYIIRSNKYLPHPLSWLITSDSAYTKILHYILHQKQCIFRGHCFRLQYIIRYMLLSSPFICAVFSATLVSIILWPSSYIKKNPNMKIPHTAAQWTLLHVKQNNLSWTGPSIQCVVVLWIPQQLSQAGGAGRLPLGTAIDL